MRPIPTRSHPHKIRPASRRRPAEAETAAGRTLRPAALLLVLLVTYGCASSNAFLRLAEEDVPVPPDSALAFQVFLIGDGGEATPDELDPALGLLQSMLATAGPRSAVVFLGDNIYPSGMPPPDDPSREEAERRIMAQLGIVEDFPGRILFVPGNHDWGGSGFGGDPARVRRQERYVESYLDRGNTFLPDGAFPGPGEVELTDSLLLVAIDTQWWMEPEKHYGNTGVYRLEQEGEFLLALDDLLRRHAEKQIVVVAHHPLFTNSSHGGRYPSEDFNPFVSLPRRYLGTPQDLSNYRYRQLRESLLDIFSHYDGLVYAAGHDHNLQHFVYGSQHYLVSGSATKLSYVDRGDPAAFAMEEHGFARLRYYTDGSTWLEFWAPAGEGTGRVLYRRRLVEGSPAPPADTTAARRPVAEAPELASPPPIETPAEIVPGDRTPLDDRIADAREAPVRVDETPEDEPPAGGPVHVSPAEMAERPYAFHTTGTVTVRAGDRYDVDGVRQLFLGEHYRDVWSMPVEVPVLDMERTAGGLTVLRRGGGLQTVSLRLQGGDGSEYVLRSIDKDPTATVPEYLRHTVAHDVVQDQIAAMHPYAAFVIPPMAAAAGIYHTRPRLVVVPDSPRLGLYRDEFAGMLALFETRPDEDQSDEARFGYAPDVIGSPRLFEKLVEDNDERVDEHAFARARLFDMFIGDWDRHSDQWRWAEFDTDPGHVYRPIPRDRDFAFFRFDGPLASLARLSGPRMRRFTDFYAGYHDLYGLNFNGAALDRRFTSRLTLEDWLAQADSLQAALTDEVIEEAVRQWPDPVYAHHGEKVVEVLKDRRDALHEAAADYYALLAEVVDVVGSDKHERFEVHRIDDATTEVVVYKTHAERDVVRELYRRTFHRNETDEVRLYALGGFDTFVLSGEAHGGVLVRIIGGPGEDVYLDETPGGAGDDTVIYDDESGNTWQVGSDVVVVRSDDPDVNRYEMLRFERDFAAPILLVGRHSDTGVEIGGGVRFVEHSFRMAPYSATHELTGKYAAGTGGVLLRYGGHLREAFGPWDARLRAEYLSERRFQHFYGLGNETDLEARDRYRAGLGRAVLSGRLEQYYWPFRTFSFGPRLEYINVDRIDTELPTRFTDEDFVDAYFAGFEARLDVDGTDTLAATASGARWLNRAAVNVALRGTDAAFVRLSSELSYFYTFLSYPRPVTIGVRIGGASNLGSFHFYQANALGGQTNLRGFPRDRFAGRHSFYQNVDLRVRLFEFNAYLVRGDGGALAFFDNGRVWADGEESGVWHQGYGGGFWLSPFYRFVLTGTVARSAENTLFDLSLGFLF